MAESAHPRVPWDEKVLDGALAAMAVWTLACNALVFLGGTLRQLLWAVPVAALAAALLYHLLVRRRLMDPADAGPEPAAGIRSFADSRRTSRNVLAIAVAAAAVYLVRTQPTFHGAWWLLVTYFSVAALLPGSAPTVAPPARAVWMQWALGCVAVACAFAALAAHRPDIDDCFYLNLSVATADAPNQPLLAHDTLHGQRDLPLCLPIYRLHSLEVLVGSLSYVTGVPVIYLAHMLVPAVGAVLCCFAWARLSRLLAPRDWLWLVILLMGAYLFVGGPHRWYSNFALVRMHQGKAILVSLCVPALIAYGLQFAAQPGWRNWCLLSLAQVAALGISSTALWVAPMAVGLALVSGSTLAPRRWKSLAAGMGTCWYPICMGLLLKPQMAAVAASLAVFNPPGDAVTHAWNDVFGTGLLRDAALVALVLAWRASPTAAAARLCQLFPLIVLVVLLNPYWAAEVTRNVTGNSAFWRVLWILPFPLFVALTLAWPITQWRSLARPWRFGGLAVACAGFVIVVPPYPTLSIRNGVEIRTPGLKVDRAYSAANAIIRATRGRTSVLAPEPVAAWIPTFHQHPYPLMARSIYLLAFQSAAPGEIQRRAALSLLMEGHGEWPKGAQMLAESIERDQLSAICFAAAHPHAEELKSLGLDHGFHPVFSDGQYEVWSKPGVKAASSSRAGVGLR